MRCRVFRIGSKYLAESGATSLTYFETTGPLGLMELASGSSLPENFPSAPGMLFPMYHVFADLAEWKTAALVSCTSSQPLTCTALAIKRAKTLHLLVMNYTAAQQHVIIHPLPSGPIWLRRLDTSTAHIAMFEPERFRQHKEPAQIHNNTLALNLSPYATVRIDIET